MKLLTFLLSIYAIQSFADPVVGAPLMASQQGKVVYYVSEANHLIHVQLPYKVEFTLIEIPSLPEKARYSLNIYGQWDSSLRRQEVLEIKQKYPGFKISEHGAGSAITGCEIRLSNGRRLECSIPNGTGDFFSVFTTLSATEGSVLKKEIEAKKFQT